MEEIITILLFAKELFRIVTATASSFTLGSSRPQPGCDQIVRLSNNKIVRMQLGHMRIHQSHVVVIDDCIMSVVGPRELGMRLAGIIQKRRQFDALGEWRKPIKLGWVWVSGVCNRACTEAR